MDSSTTRHVENRAQTSPRWVKILADNFEAVVSVDTIRWACHGEPHFLTRVLESELANGADAATMRLDCDADVGKHVVASLRCGHDYLPPYDNQQLLRAVRHQLLLLGLPVRFGTRPAHESTEVVLVPAYRTHMRDEPPDDPGLLVYNSTGHGWAELTGSRDTRPNDMRTSDRGYLYSGRWLAGSLRRECTGAGTDLVYAIRNDPPGPYNHPKRYGYTGVLMEVGTNKYQRLQLPPYFGAFYNRGMSASNDKVFLLGGDCNKGWSNMVWNWNMSLTAVSFHVLDPHIGSWLAAASPMPEFGAICPNFWSRPAVISDQHGSLVVCLGGKIVDPELAEEQASPMTDFVAMYDVRGGSWQQRPSGCRWPSAATATSLTAVAADPNTLMVMSTHRQPTAAIKATQAALQAELASLDLDSDAPAATVKGVSDHEKARTELLDICTWRWRPGAALQSDYRSLWHTDGAGTGLVQYQGEVLSIGGRHPRRGASTDVHQYNVGSDSWSPLAPLPFPIEYAAPVVVDFPSTLKK